MSEEKSAIEVDQHDQPLGAPNDEAPEPPKCICGELYARASLPHKAWCPAKPEASKVSNRKLLKRSIQARYRYYSPSQWAAAKEKEDELARLAAGEDVAVQDVETNA